MKNYTKFDQFVVDYNKARERITKTKTYPVESLRKVLTIDDLFLLIIKKVYDCHGDFEYAVKNAKLHMEDKEEAFDLFVRTK